MSDHIRVFSKDAICPKCGHDEIAIQWCPGYYKKQSKAWVVDNTVCANILEREGLKTYKDDQHVLVIIATSDHMHRVCQGCTYNWMELPLDQAHPLEQLAAQADD